MSMRMSISKGSSDLPVTFLLTSSSSSSSAEWESDRDQGSGVGRFSEVMTTTTIRASGGYRSQRDYFNSENEPIDINECNQIINDHRNELKKISGFEIQKKELEQIFQKLEAALQSLKDIFVSNKEEDIRKILRINIFIELDEWMQAFISSVDSGKDERATFERKKAEIECLIEDLLKTESEEKDLESLSQSDDTLFSKWYENILVKNLSSRQMLHGTVVVFCAIITLVRFYYFASSVDELDG